MRKHTRTTIIHIMANTTLACITVSGIKAIGMAGTGIRVTGTLVQSRLLCPRIDMPSSQDCSTLSEIDTEKKKDPKKEKGCH
jgi:hypothetical protein